MRTYVVDELDEEILEKLRSKLTDMQLQSAILDVYWFPVPEHLYRHIQQEHAHECGPYVMALEINGDSVKLEFLVRGHNVLHCSCVGYATPELEQYMMRYLDGLLEC